ncbi:MAG TPA: hypothetical protein VFD49_08075 [Candidatus Dormibacteraeota bacterium]|nr:hypothetical protein [Candidatus Dormibacteraeota bacterium]
MGGERRRPWPPDLARRWEGLGPRRRRAVGLIALSLLILGAAAAVDLHRGGAPSPTRRPGLLTGADWISAREGWIVLTDPGVPESVLFATSDGGAHWRRQLTAPGPLAVQFLGPKLGFATEQPGQEGGAPRLLQTTDGGGHWRELNLPGPGDAGAPVFVDAERGWLLAGTGPGVVVLYRTLDGGRDWEALPPVGDPGRAGPGPAAATSLWFRDASNGWLGGVAGDGSAVVYVTRDGGRSWRGTPLPEPVTGPGGGHDLQVLIPSLSRTGVGALPVLDASSRSAEVYLSTDGGETWRNPVPAPGGAAPVFVDGRDGWLLDGRRAWTSSDSGRSWRARTPAPAGWQFDGFLPVSASVALARLVPAGAVVDETGPWRLVRTVDGGRSWHQIPLPGL